MELLNQKAATLCIKCNFRVVPHFLSGRMHPFSQKFSSQNATWYATMADRCTTKGRGGRGRVSFGIWNFCMSLNYCNIIRVFIWHAPRGDRGTDRVCTQFCGKWQKNAAEHIDNEEDIEVSLKSLENWAPTADERWENWKLATDNWAALRLNWNWWCARYWFARWFTRRQT